MVNTLLMWIGGLLAVVLAAMFSVPYFVDWNGYRGVFEEGASRILGRDVRVGGKINVRLLPTPYLRFEKLRIADTSPAASGPIFEAETFTLWLSVPPLLQGNLEARHLALDKPLMTLAVDDKGVGNWSTLGVKPGTLPFMPHKVALQAVNITDGTIVLRHPRAGEVGRLTGLVGVVSAEALDGPYKFAGDAELAGAKREIRIVTANRDPDGTLRFKATARPIGTTETAFQLDGSLNGIAQRPQITGNLTAKVLLPVLPGTEPSAASPAGTVTATDAASNPGAPVFADIKGQLVADAERLELSQVQASIENVGQPQLLTGGMTLEWGQLKRLDFEFASRWLDLDRLAGTQRHASPLETAVALINGMTAVLPSQSATRGVIAIDQLTIGGAPSAKLDLAVSRVGAGALRIERMFAELPAGVRIAIDGMLDARSANTEFDGRVTAAGPSLKRLAAWAMPAHTLASTTPDGPFKIDSRLKVGAGGLAFDNAKAEFSDHPLSGSLSLSEAGALKLDLASNTFESDWLWSGGLNRRSLLAWLDQVAAEARRRADARVAEAKQAAARPATQSPPAESFSFKFAAGLLRGPDRTLRDVDIDLKLAGGVLKLNRLAFNTADGFQIDVSGQMRRDTAEAAGQLTGLVAASDEAAMTTGFTLLDVPENARVKQLAAMTPMRLAGDLALGKRSAGAVDLNVDGSAKSGRISMRANVNRAPADDWRSAPAEITISAEDAPGEQLIALIFGNVPAAAKGAPAAAPLLANVAIKAVGVPAEGMVTDAAISRTGLNLAYNGRVSFDAAMQPTLAGNVEVAADRFGDVLALVGAGNAGASGDRPVTGTLGLSFANDGRTRLSPSGLTVAGSQIGGTLYVSRGENARLVIDGELVVDQIAVAGLLASLVATAPRSVPVSAADLAFQSSQGLWTDQPFSSEAFDRFEGKLTLLPAQLSVAPGLNIERARLAFTLAPGRIDVTIAEGVALNGKLNGAIALERGGAGARAKVNLEISGASLAELSHSMASQHEAGGSASASVDLAGQALSPRSLITELKGKGRITLVDAWIEGLSPEGVAATIAAAFAKQIEIDAGTLQTELLKRTGQGRLNIGSRDVALDVSDGVLRVAAFETALASGRVETLTTVDLSNFSSETEWRLTAASNQAARTAWPPVSIFYNGPLGSLKSVTPRVALGSFERELTVRRMEREVDELERLRKEDEERARLERERQKALAEAQRIEREKALEAERARQQQQPAPQTSPQNWPIEQSGPRSEFQPSAAPPPDSATQSQAVPSEPAAASPPPAAAAATPPPASASPPPSPPAAAQDTAASPAQQTSEPRRTPRRVQQKSPSAGDTLLRSINPGYN